MQDNNAVTMKSKSKLLYDIDNWLCNVIWTELC